MKKGLFVCYDPHALMQFLQFYCMNDFPAEWDVLCLPVENGEEYMHSYCGKTGIFKNVFTGEIEYIKLHFFRKIGLFLYMFFFAIIGLRKKCCKNILNKYVKDIDQYDIFCSNIDTGFISGMLASFAKEKEVIYFEDGAGDYTIKRSKWRNSVFPVLSFTNFQCVILAWLGYCAKGYVYFDLTKYCYKYVTNSAVLEYTNYKHIKEFELSGKALELYQAFLKRIYPDLEGLIISKKSIIFFTDPLSDFLDDYEEYSKKITDSIGKSFKSVYIKRHPRDTSKYLFSKDVEVRELNSHIPSEVFFPFMKDVVCCFDEISSIIIGLKPIVSKIVVYHIADFDNMGLKNKYRTISEKKEYLDKFIRNKYEIIII